MDRLATRAGRTRLVRVDLDAGEQVGVDGHPVFDLDTPAPRPTRASRPR